MSVALAAQNKTKISFFLCPYFLLLCISRKIYPRTHFRAYNAPQLYTRALQVLLSVHLKNRSIKKMLIRPLCNKYNYNGVPVFKSQRYRA